jgi:voltage-gated potassium channel
MRKKIYEIIFEHDTKAEKLFDVVLLWLILLSVFVVMIESIPEVKAVYFRQFYTIEWIFTILFTLEYAARIWSSPKRLIYIFSFWGLIDLLSILPTYLELLLPGYHYLMIIRIFRLMRVFRILKLVRFNREAEVLFHALRRSSHKIAVFLVSVVSVVTMLGTLMYVIEGGKNGFTSIPAGIYWAVVTVTTVGFGDIVPQTVLGKFLSSISMIIGYSIIAVPTGIITVELSKNLANPKHCDECGYNNAPEANYCSQCGNMLDNNG